MSTLTLQSPDLSYLVGLIQTDGHYAKSTRNRGRISIELSGKDSPLLESINQVFPDWTSLTSRTRTTNFSPSYTSTILNIYRKDVRDFFEASGVPSGRKSHDVAPPSTDFSERDYVRGLIDGDGSVGFTSKGVPFLSFVTDSRPLAEYFCGVIERVTGTRRVANRNTRDGVFNVVVGSVVAVKLASWMYENASIKMPRKASKAVELHQWVPPSSRFGAKLVAWTPEEDEVVQASTIAVAAEKLGRSRSSVANRRFRLRSIPR